jgi:electron transfer flavoprotein beta subunit
MKIAVCVKQVPDTTRVEVDQKTGTLRREGVESVLNPLDSFAVEEALRLRERCGGSVTAISMGPPQAEAMLREVMAFGVDDAVLVSGREFAGSDTWATSLALAAAVQHCDEFNLVMCGKQATDGDTGHVGPELAVHLGWPHLTCVSKIRDINHLSLVAERLTDTGHQLVRVSLPAVLTAVKELNEPRMPNLADLYRGRFKDVKHLNAADLGVDAGEVGLDGSPTRVVQVFSPDRARGGRIFEDDLEAGIDLAAEMITERMSRE